MSSTTRERIVDEAMRLFSERGYAATSIATIEAAAGLSPGAGGLYHHFDSKQALLTAGVERQLARLEALRDIRRVLVGLGDLKAELTLIARYVLAELDREAELMRILAAQARSHPELLSGAVDQLVSSTFDGFASWVGDSSGEPDGDRAAAIAALGLGSLLCNRILRDVFGAESKVDDETLVGAWVPMMMSLLGGAPA
ncbi:MAG TPA: TetR/AcrR family transcriptional regulator [Solirubrobacteraceae bacterium]|nr:TetR/AcrR family transcriptional regulator [Solirubrobacteraceae bacterium]